MAKDKKPKKKPKSTSKSRPHTKARPKNTYGSK